MPCLQLNPECFARLLFRNLYLQSNLDYRPYRMSQRADLRLRVRTVRTASPAQPRPDGERHSSVGLARIRGIFIALPG